MPFANDVFRKLNIDTNPATTLLIPKSSTPNTRKNTRDVYKDTNNTNIMRIERNMVFFAMVLLPDAMIIFYETMLTQMLE